MSAPAIPATPVTEAAPNLSISQAIDSIGTIDTPVQETPETVEAPETPAAEETPAPETPAKEPTEEPETPVGEKEDPFADDDEFPEPVGEREDKRGRKLLMYEQGRLDRWKERSAQIQQLQQEIPEFSVDKAKEHYQVAVSARQLVDDLDSADPGNLGKVIGLLGGASDDGKWQRPHTLGLIAMQLPDVLQKVNPNAYNALADGLFDRKMDALYRQGMQGDENLFKACQVIEHALTGGKKFRTQDDFKQQQPAAPDAERQRFEAERQEFQQQKAREQETRVTTAEQQTDSAISAAQTEEIEKALAPVKTQYEQRPRAWKNLVASFEDKIAEKLENAPTWLREENQIRDQMKRAVASGNNRAAETHRAALLTRYRTLISEVVRANRKGLIEADTKEFLANNSAVHEKAAAAGTKREPAAASKPIPAKTDMDSVIKSVKDAPTMAEAFRRGGF